MAYLKIKGTDVSSLVQGLTITLEPVWSANTGRVASAKMVGDIVGNKWTLEVAFVPLNDEQTKTIESLLYNDAFFSIQFKNPRKNALDTITVYAGARSYPVYSYANGLPRYVGAAVKLIEQ